MNGGCRAFYFKLLTMKTKLLKRLRKEAGKAINCAQIEMRDMGIGRNVWRINGWPARDVFSKDELQNALNRNRRYYILAQISKLRKNKST